VIIEDNDLTVQDASNQVEPVQDASNQVEPVQDASNQVDPVPVASNQVDPVPVASIQVQMENFVQSSQMIIELAGLSMEERHQVHKMAEELNLQHISKYKEGQRILTVAKPEAILGTPTVAKQVRSELIASSNYEIPSSQEVAQTLEAPLEEPTGETKKRGRKPGSKNKDVRAINEHDSSTTPIAKRVSQRRRN
jgi:hypothetical protein